MLLEIVQCLIGAMRVIVCTYMCICSGHRGGVKEPSGHERDPVWD